MEFRVSLIMEWGEEGYVDGFWNTDDVKINLRDFEIFKMISYLIRSDNEMTLSKERITREN